MHTMPAWKIHTRFCVFYSNQTLITTYKNTNILERASETA